MKLPIAIHYDGEIYTEVELKEAVSGDIAKTHKKIGSGNLYEGLLTFAVAVTESIEGYDGDIKSILKKAPFESVYAICILGMAKTRGETRVSGQYTCPKCHTVSEHIDGAEGDYADDLDSLFGEFTEEDTFEIKCDVEIKKKDQAEQIQEITMRYPLMEDVISAYRKYPDDNSQMQFEIYANTVLAVNGNEVDKVWRATFGSLVFQKMKYSDLKNLNNSYSKYSYGQVECVCMKCKNRWKSMVDVGNFFALDQ